MATICTVTYTYDFALARDTWGAVGHPCLSIFFDGADYPPWLQATKSGDTPVGSVYAFHYGADAGSIGYARYGTWAIEIKIGDTDGDAPYTYELVVGGTTVFTGECAESFDKDEWSIAQILASPPGSGTISDAEVSSGWDIEWDAGGNIYITLGEAPPVELRGPRVIRFANGVEMVSRAGSVWRRLSADHAWAAARTATDTAPVILPSIARVGNAVCLDTAAVQSASAGTGWTTSPPTSVLPTDVAGWPRGTDGVRDLLVSDANGKALGVSLEAGALKAYLQGQSTVTLASLGTATVGGPVVGRDSQGRWYVGALVDGTWREWRTGSSWSSWTELSAQSLGTTAAWSTACLWVGRNGMQLLAGYHKTAGKVRAMWRTGYAAAWSSPADIATVAVDTAPYAVQTTTGQWEIGWRTATAWVLYRAATPGGTWTVVA